MKGAMSFFMMITADGSVAWEISSLSADLQDERNFETCQEANVLHFVVP